MSTSAIVRVVHCRTYELGKSRLRRVTRGQLVYRPCLHNWCMHNCLSNDFIYSFEFVLWNMKERGRRRHSLGIVRLAFIRWVNDRWRAAGWLCFVVEMVVDCRSLGRKTVFNREHWSGIHPSLSFFSPQLTHLLSFSLSLSLSLSSSLLLSPPCLSLFLSRILLLSPHSLDVFISYRTAALVLFIGMIPTDWAGRERSTHLPSGITHYVELIPWESSALPSA